MEDIREPEELARFFTPQADAELAPGIKTRRKGFQHCTAIQWPGVSTRDTTGVARSRLQQCLKRLNITVPPGTQISPCDHATQSHGVEHPIGRHALDVRRVMVSDG